MLKLDPVLFEQALFNILDNAAKYAPAGSTILIRAEQVSGGVQLQIVDEGEGIPEQTSRRFLTSSTGSKRVIGPWSQNRARPADLSRLRGSDGRHHSSGKPT